MFDIVFLKLGLKKVCHKNFFFEVSILKQTSFSHALPFLT